jgi:hypothetical protein
MNNYKKQTIKAPILLIGFNRPEVIQESFNFIRLAKPSKFFVSVDAARPDKAGESQQVDAVKRIVQQVDWECEVFYKFNDINQGAEVTVSSAISWVLEKEETVIVLEDDIIAHLAFLEFAQLMLEKYKTDENVFMISGNQFTEFNLNNDYCFGMHGHTWGWATWRRAWNHFDLNVAVSDKFIEILDHPDNNYSFDERIYFKRRFEKMKNNGPGNNTWDLCWNYIRLLKGGLSIIPSKNLTSNIGVFGLHNHGFKNVHFLGMDINFKCTKHPEKIVRNVAYDTHHYTAYLAPQKSLLIRIMARLEKTLRIDQLKYALRKRDFAQKKKILFQR